MSSGRHFFALKYRGIRSISGNIWEISIQIGAFFLKKNNYQKIYITYFEKKIRYAWFDLVDWRCSWRLMAEKTFPTLFIATIKTV